MQEKVFLAKVETDPEDDHDHVIGVFYTKNAADLACEKHADKYIECLDCRYFTEEFTVGEIRR